MPPLTNLSRTHVADKDQDSPRGSGGLPLSRQLQNSDQGTLKTGQGSCPLARQWQNSDQT